MWTKGLFGAQKNALAAFGPQDTPQPNALRGVGLGQQPAPMPQPDYGDRVDGTKKGKGFLGEIKTPDGQIMTEYSIGIDWGDGEQEIPTIVPGLSPEEIHYLARGGDPTPAIIDKAVSHAQQRLRMGLSPFAMRGLDYE
jgi:hypothetical protein